MLDPVIVTFAEKNTLSLALLCERVRSFLTEDPWRPCVQEAEPIPKLTTTAPEVFIHTES